MKKILTYSFASLLFFISANFTIRQSGFSGTNHSGYKNDEETIKTANLQYLHTGLSVC